MIWIPAGLWGRLKHAQELSGFNSTSGFIVYIVRRWLEEHGFLFSGLRHEPPRMPPAAEAVTPGQAAGGGEGVDSGKMSPRRGGKEGG